MRKDFFLLSLHRRDSRRSAHNSQYYSLCLRDSDALEVLATHSGSRLAWFKVSTRAEQGVSAGNFAFELPVFAQTPAYLRVCGRENTVSVAMRVNVRAIIGVYWECVHDDRYDKVIASG